MPSRRGPLSRFVLSLAVAAGVLAIARAIAPHLVVSERVAGMTTFFGASLLGVLVVAMASRAPLAVGTLLVIDGLAAALLGLVALVFVTPHAISLVVPVSIDVALLALACATGAFVGSRIQHPGHLLPACVVAGCADVVSVFSPHGPTHALAESERALSLLAISFPVLGTHSFAPALGVGDLLFLSLILSAVSAHRLPYRKTVLLAALGILGAGLVAMHFQTAVPALPFLAAPVIAWVPQARTIARKDRTVTTIAIGASLVIAAWTLFAAFRPG